MKTIHHAPHVRCTRTVIELTTDAQIIHHCDYWEHADFGNHECDCGHLWVTRTDHD